MIAEPMKKFHGCLRDRDAVEREVALIMREILDQGFFQTKLSPRQLATLVISFNEGKNDTEIARELGNEKLAKTVARARVRIKLFRDSDFDMPFERRELSDLIDSGKTMNDVSQILGISSSSLRDYRHDRNGRERHARPLQLEWIIGDPGPPDEFRKECMEGFQP